MHEAIDALKIIHQNEKYLSPSVQNVIMNNLMSHEELMDRTEENSPYFLHANLKYLKLIAKELSNEKIGEKLFIRERTVEAHRRNIFIKTKTKSIVGLIKYAINEGLISIDPD